MGFAGSGAFIGTVLLVAAVAAALIYGYMEYQVRMLSTTITKLNTGLLFTSRFLTVSTRNASQEVVINAPQARHTEDQSAADIEKLPWREIAVVMSAPGWSCQVSPQTTSNTSAIKVPADRCTIRFQSGDAAKLEALGLPLSPVVFVSIEDVPLPVARSFQSFAAQVGMWVERVEQRIRLERDATQKRLDEEAQVEVAKAAAAQRAADRQAQPKGDDGKPLSEEERLARGQAQIDALRKAAGFKGSSSEVSLDARGKIQWFIDLDSSGRAILQSGSRTFHGSLKGAKVTTLTGELELGVRDALWTEDDPQLSNFNIMAGAKAETRLAWKERLEILIRSLR